MSNHGAWAKSRAHQATAAPIQVQVNGVKIGNPQLLSTWNFTFVNATLSTDGKTITYTLSPIPNSGLATMPPLTIKANVTSVTATPQDATVAQINAMLGTLTQGNTDVSQITNAVDQITENDLERRFRLLLKDYFTNFGFIPLGLEQDITVALSL